MVAYRNNTIIGGADNKPSLPNKFRGIMTVSILTLSTILFSWLTYTSYKYSGKPESIESIRLVRKDIAPIRTQPADPGGENLINQDKLIYKNFESSPTGKDGNSTVKKTDAKESNAAKPEGNPGKEGSRCF